MFNMFKKKKPVDELIDAIKGAAPVSAKEPLPEKKVANDQPVYQVGKTTDGRVTFRMQNDYGYTTLTMNNEGVNGLIRMLEAAMEPEEHTGNPTDE